MHGETVVVAPDAGGVERPQEDPVGADERAPQHGHVGVRPLDRWVGRPQEGRVALGLVRAGEVLLVGLVGLVPDFDRREACAVTPGQIGDDIRVGGGVAWRPGGGVARSSRHAPAQQRRRGRGSPAGRAVHKYDYADASVRRVRHQTVGEGERCWADLARLKRLKRRPAHLGAYDPGIELAQRGDLAVGSIRGGVGIAADNVHSAQRRDCRQAPTRQAMGVAWRRQPHRQACAKRQQSDRLGRPLGQLPVTLSHDEHDSRGSESPRRQVARAARRLPEVGCCLPCLQPGSGRRSRSSCSL